MTSRPTNPLKRIVERAAEIIGVSFYVGMGLLVLGVFFWMFAAQNRAHGQPVDIPEACQPLASLIGLPPAPTREQADAAIAELRLSKYDSIPAVQACREAIRPPKRKPPRWRRGITTGPQLGGPMPLRQ